MSFKQDCSVSITQQIQINDSAYKRFFSDPLMVASLLTDLIPNTFNKELDFSSLTKISNEYVTQDLRHRFNDIVWKVKWRDSWAYLLLMLEFQSKPDHWMAFRITQYTTLLFSDLIKTDSVKANGKFPAIFPIVIYNGSRHWNAVQNIGDLIVSIPDELQVYQPRQQYYLLDIGNVPEHILHNEESLTVQLVRLEHSKKPEDMWAVVRSLRKILCSPENEDLRKTFALWISVVAKRSGIVADNVPTFSDLMEVEDMLEESMVHWKDDYISRGKKHWKDDYINKWKDKWEEENIEAKNEEGKGLKYALNAFLKTRFGIASDEISPHIAETSDPEILKNLMNCAFRANSLEEFKKELQDILNKPTTAD